MARKYLLSLDGGGVRGILPVCALIALEQATGRLTREVFDFVAGTSTGAILAAGIAAGVPAGHLLHLYLDRAQEVFPRRPWNGLRWLCGAQYSTQKLRQVVAEESGLARTWRINDAPLDLLITAKGLADGMPWYFVRNNPRTSGRTGHLSLVDCATASAAAPTYFAPWTIPEDRETLRQQGWELIGPLVDGGVGVAGNPTYQACVEAFEYTHQYTPEETVVVSLGTGRFGGKRPRPSHLLSWIPWVLAELLESAGEQQTELVTRHYPQMPFYRLDVQLPQDIPAQEAKGEHLDLLYHYGQQFAQTIDWHAILEGRDSPFQVTPERTLPAQYSYRLR